MKHLAPFFFLLIGMSGCSVIHPSVPVYGEPVSLVLLDGIWDGSYSSQDSGRSGGIYFDLKAEVDSAVGEVVMFSPGRYVPPNPSMRDGRPQFDATHSQVLTISFVRAEGRQISGSLSPYTDPDCGCTLSTTFVGQLDGDRIEGTFISLSRDHSHTNRGTWEVTRKQP